MKAIRLITVLLVFAGCSNNDYLEITDQCTFIYLFSGSCFGEPSGDINDEYIFQDSAHYFAFMDSMYLDESGVNCDTASIPSIDFENYILLGKYATGDGCSVNFKKRIYRDSINQQIIYQIDVISSGWCDMLAYSNNWVLVPRQLFYEDVIFSVNE